jgi:hypothetical protein
LLPELESAYNELCKKLPIGVVDPYKEGKKMEVEVPESYVNRYLDFVRKLCGPLKFKATINGTVIEKNAA